MIRFSYTFIRVIAAAVLLPALLAAGIVPCGAEERVRGARWMLLTGEGLVRARDVRPGRDGESITVTDLSGGKGEMPLDSCLGLMRRVGTRPMYGRNRDGRAGIELRCGDTILAADVGYREETLTARHPFWKELSFPSGLVRRIRVRRDRTLPPAAPSFEGVRFANGDEVAGRVVSIVGETILVEVEAVGKVPVESFDSVADIVLAPAGGSKEKADSYGSRTVAVLCRSGDLVRGRLQGEDAGAWIVGTSWRKEPVRIPASEIRSVGFLGTNVFLSDMKPSRADMTPFIDSIKPWSADASVDGRPMTVRGYLALKGLGMHSRTVLEFPIGALSTDPLRFCCLLGIDAASFAGAGDADFAVAADGKTLEKGRVVSGAELQPVFADVPAGAKALTFTLDYGRRGSSGDYADVMWAALMRVKGPPEPEAAPPEAAP